MTGLADAFLDRAPVVALTGQTGLAEMHKESHQYIDIVRMMKPVTKWNARIHDASIIPEAVRKAFAVAEREKPGATHLELPDDVIESEAVGRARAAPRTAAGRAGRGRAAPRRRAAAGGGAAGDPGRQRRRPPERVGGAAPLLPADRPERDHDLHGQGRRRRRRLPLALHRGPARPGLSGRVHGPGRPRRLRRLRPGRVVARGLEPDPRPAHHLHRHRRCRDRPALRPRGRADRRHRPHPHAPRQPGIGEAARPARHTATTGSSCARRSTRAPTTASRSSRSGCCATCAS